MQNVTSFEMNRIDEPNYRYPNCRLLVEESLQSRGSGSPDISGDYPHPTHRLHRLATTKHLNRLVHPVPEQQTNGTLGIRTPSHRQQRSCHPIISRLLHGPQTSQQILHGHRHSHRLGWSRGLLRSKTSLRHALPQRPIRGSHNRRAEIYAYDRRTGDACYFQRHSFPRELRLRGTSPPDNLGGDAQKRNLRQNNGLHGNHIKHIRTGFLRARNRHNLRNALRLPIPDNLEHTDRPKTSPTRISARMHRNGYVKSPEVAHEAMFLWYLEL